MVLAMDEGRPQRTEEARSAAPFASLGVLLLTLSFIPGCATSGARMKVGEPLEWQRTLCFGNTQFQQNGEDLDWDNTMGHLAKRKESAPHVATGNGLAIASIVTTVVAVPSFAVGGAGLRDQIKMSDEAAAGLLGLGIASGIASFVLCTSSEAKYIDAAEAYNAGITARRGEQRGVRDGEPAVDSVDAQGTAGADQRAYGSEDEKPSDMPVNDETPGKRKRNEEEMRPWRPPE